MVTFNPYGCFVDSLHNSWIRDCHADPASTSLLFYSAVVKAKALCLLGPDFTTNPHLPPSFSFLLSSPSPSLISYNNTMWPMVVINHNKFITNKQHIFILSYHVKRQKSKVPFPEVDRAGSGFGILAESFDCVDSCKSCTPLLVISHYLTLSLLPPLRCSPYLSILAILPYLPTLTLFSCP